MTTDPYRRERQQGEVESSSKLAVSPFDLRVPERLSTMRDLRRWSLESSLNMWHRQLLLFCLLVVAVAVIAQDTSCTEVLSPFVFKFLKASWLDWSAWSTCSSDCGSCGIQIRTRTCLTTVSSCSCSGCVSPPPPTAGSNSTDLQYCNVEICRYPRASCCFGFVVTTYNGVFSCLAQSTFTG